ncbi:MAG: hypothetical protein HYY96_00925 [Candidatus Tectomicrobia bacterium]|nr:hypothetical protein [Candidatus Tectomicrobia bacterium]
MGLLVPDPAMTEEGFSFSPPSAANWIDETRSVQASTSESLQLPKDPWSESVWINLLRSFYQFSNTTDVITFLIVNPFLIGLLLDATEQIRECVGQNVELVLRFVSEPEEDDSEELFVFIMTGLPVEEALKRLNVLHEKWWLEASSRGRCLLNIGLGWT